LRQSVRYRRLRALALCIWLWVLDRSGAGAALVGYRSGAAVLAAIALIGVVAAFRLRETRCRNIYAGLGGAKQRR